MNKIGNRYAPELTFKWLYGFLIQAIGIFETLDIWKVLQTIPLRYQRPVVSILRLAMTFSIFAFLMPSYFLIQSNMLSNFLKFQTWSFKFSYWKDSQETQHNEGNYTHSKVYHHKILVHWGKREHLISFKTEYILMTVSLLPGSSRVLSTKINICNISEFLTNFIPQSARSKYLNIGPCY